MTTEQPTSVGATLAIGTTLLGALAVGMYSPASLLLGLIGTVVLVIGVLLPRPGVMTTGSTGLFVAAVTAGVEGAPVEAVMIAVVAAVVSWDVAQNAASLGRQVGSGTETTRSEAVHFAASLGVGVIAGGVGYGVYLGMAGGYSATAVGFLVVGSLLVVLALR